MSQRGAVRWVTHRLNGAFIVGGSYLGSRYAPLPLSWLPVRPLVALRPPPSRNRPSSTSF